MKTTLKAMTRIEQIRRKREHAFYKNRMRGNKERQFALDKKLVEENAELLKMRDVELKQKALKAASKQDQEMASEEEEISDEDMDVSSEDEEEKTAQKIMIKNKRKSRVRF